MLLHRTNHKLLADSETQELELQQALSNLKKANELEHLIFRLHNLEPAHVNQILAESAHLLLKKAQEVHFSKTLFNAYFPYSRWI
jgi:hypothetical protein